MARKRKTNSDVGEEFPREVGTVVRVDDVTGLPYEIRKDGSIAYFTQEKAEDLREVGS